MTKRRRVWLTVYALSPREHYVCQGLVQRLSYKQIAGVLDVALSTVKNQADEAMDKLDAADKDSLAEIYEHACAIERARSNGLRDHPTWRGRSS